MFTPSERELAWAHEVLAAFDAAGGAALRLPDGEFVVDLPVAQRARRVLQLAADLDRLTDVSVERASRPVEFRRPRGGMCGNGASVYGQADQLRKASR